MINSPLEQVQELIKQLSAEERQHLIPFLASLPDSGLHSYDLNEEIEVIEQSTKIQNPPPGGMPEILFELLIPVRNVTAVLMGGREVFRAVFRPENFVEGWPIQVPSMQTKVIEGLRTETFTDELKAHIKTQREASGMQEDDAAFERALNETCEEVAGAIVSEKAKRVAEGISIHLPRIIGDLFDAAIQGQTFADYNRVADTLGRPDKKIPASKLRRMLTDRYWRDVKGHLGVRQGGAHNVKHVWTDDDRKCLAENYDRLKPIWIEAKRIAKAAQDSRESTRKKGWRNGVLAVYPELPDDLLERYATPQGDEAKPSTIAIFHALRICLPGLELSAARLRKEVKAWKSKAAS